MPGRVYACLWAAGSEYTGRLRGLEGGSIAQGHSTDCTVHIQQAGSPPRDWRDRGARSVVLLQRRSLMAKLDIWPVRGRVPLRRYPVPCVRVRGCGLWWVRVQRHEKAWCCSRRYQLLPRLPRPSLPAAPRTLQLPRRSSPLPSPLGPPAAELSGQIRSEHVDRALADPRRRMPTPTLTLTDCLISAPPQDPRSRPPWPGSRPRP